MNFNGSSVRLQPERAGWVLPTGGWEILSKSKLYEYLFVVRLIWEIYYLAYLWGIIFSRKRANKSSSKNTYIYFKADHPYGVLLFLSPEKRLAPTAVEECCLLSSSSRISLLSMTAWKYWTKFLSSCRSPNWELRSPYTSHWPETIWPSFSTVFKHWHIQLVFENFLLWE